MSDARADYEQIRTTWRFQEEVVKRSMLRELEDALKATDLGKTLAMDIAKLVDALQTELHLEEGLDTE